MLTTRSRRTVSVALGLALLMGAACSKSPTGNEAVGTNAGTNAGTSAVSAPGSSATTGSEAGGRAGSPSSTQSSSSSTKSNPSTTRPSGGNTPSVQRLEGPITVVALGDSLTEGQGDDDGLGYTGRLQRALDDRGHAGSEVVNLGASGWDSKQVNDGLEDTPSQLSRMEAPIAEAKRAGRPIVATYLIGSNDLWYLYNNEGPTTADQENENLQAYRSNLQRTVKALRDAGAIVVLGINDDQTKRPFVVDENKRRETFYAFTSEKVPQMSAQARKYADVVRQVASENGALVADFLDAGFFFDQATMADDGAHPNGKGYEEMTKVWLAAMQPLL